MSEDFPNKSGHCVLYLKSLLIALALVFDLYGAVHLPCPSDCSYAGWEPKSDTLWNYVFATHGIL